MTSNITAGRTVGIMEPYSCKPCDKVFNGIRPYSDHLASKLHQKKMQQTPSSVVDSPRNALRSSNDQLNPFIEKLGMKFRCTLCKLYLNSLDQVRSHVFGSKHKKLQDYCTTDNEKDLSSLSNIKLTPNPNDKEAYSDFEFSFRDMHFKNVLENVKTFGVNDPIIF